MRTKRTRLCAGAALMAVGMSASCLAADVAPGQPPKSNYQIQIEITGEDGTPRRYAVVTTGGRVEASFAAPGVDLNVAEAPSILKFEAEFELLEPNKMWLRRFTVGQSVPFVTGTRMVGPGLAREPRTVGPNGETEPPQGVPGDRLRQVQRRAVREPGAFPEPDTADRPAAGPPTARMAPGPFGQVRSVTYRDVGTISSVLLTIGKPVVVSEDATQRVTLTAKRLDDQP